MNTPPVPAELPLPIPGPVGFFTLLLIVSFILHLIFVKMMIGGTIVALVTEYLGIKNKNSLYDRLAKDIITITSVNKSIAVVLGVAPLLLLSVLYTGFFYSSTILIGKAWISIVPIVIVAFLFLYAYKFKWETMLHNKKAHMLLGFGGAIPLLFVPLIFSTNMVLMRHPEIWLETSSFWQAIFLPTVFPRYFHFVNACIALIGLMVMGMAYWQGRKPTSPAEISYLQWVMGYGLKITLFSVAGQFILGPILLLSQPPPILFSFLGGSNTYLLLIALALAIALLLLLYKNHTYYKESSESKLMQISRMEQAATIESSPTQWVKKFKLPIIFALLLVLLLTMGTIRHQIRDLHLSPYWHLYQNNY